MWCCIVCDLASTIQGRDNTTYRALFVTSGNIFMKIMLVIFSIILSIFILPISTAATQECQRIENMGEHYSENIETISDSPQFITRDIRLSSNKSITTILATSKHTCDSRKGCIWGIYQTNLDNSFCYLGKLTGSPTLLTTAVNSFYDFVVLYRGTAAEGMFTYTYSFNPDNYAYEIIEKEVVIPPVTTRNNNRK